MYTTNYFLLSQMSLKLKVSQVLIISALKFLNILGIQGLVSYEPVSYKKQSKFDNFCLISNNFVKLSDLSNFSLLSRRIRFTLVKVKVFQLLFQRFHNVFQLILRVIGNFRDFVKFLLSPMFWRQWWTEGQCNLFFKLHRASLYYNANIFIRQIRGKILIWLDLRVFNQFLVLVVIAKEELIILLSCKAQNCFSKA